MKNKDLKVLLEEIDSDLVLAGEPEKVYTGQFTDEEKRMIDMAAMKIIESLQKASHNIADRIEQTYPHLKPTDLDEASPVIVELMRLVLKELQSAAEPPPGSPHWTRC